MLKSDLEVAGQKAGKTFGSFVVNDREARKGLVTLLKTVQSLPDSGLKDIEKRLVAALKRLPTLAGSESEALKALKEFDKTFAS